LIKPELEKIKSEIESDIIQEEDVLSYALLPQVAKNFFKFRNEGANGIKDEVETTKQDSEKEIKIAAAISAAIAVISEEENVELMVKSIRRVNQNWNMASKLSR